MSANSRLTIALHILTWIAWFSDQQEVATSEQIAGSVNTNPVVVRRLLGLLENAHLVRVQRGKGAGWKLAREPEEITLLDVHYAVEQGPLFALHNTPPNPDCPVGKGIQSGISGLYTVAEEALHRELARSTIADVLQNIRSRSSENDA